MKFFKSIILFLASIFFISTIYAQANPYISVLPLNSGLVNLGSSLDIQVTIGNTGSASIVAAKLRPVITVPPLVTFLPNVEQIGLPAGWIIVSNTGSQIRICNNSDVIAGSSSRNIILKVQGVAIGGPTTFQGVLNFGGVSCAVAGAAPAGNNTADDVATSTLTIVAGCSLSVTANATSIPCNGGTATISVASAGVAGVVEYGITGTITLPFQTGNSFTVPAGTYTVTARDVANPLSCVATTSITVAEPAVLLAPTINVTQPTCAVTSGLVTITSPTTGLLFSIDGGVYNIYPTAGFLLTPGLHTIQTKNANNCLSPILNVSVNAPLITPATPIIGTITQPDCVISTGAIVLNGLPSSNWVINPGAITGNTTSTTINNLTSGTYTFNVTNADGCTSISTASLIITAVVGAPLAPAISLVQPTCTVATGKIIITSNTAGFTFSLDGAPYTAYPSGGFTGIAAGSHTLIAQNISGCLSPFTNIIINPQPLSPVVPTISIVQPTCTSANGIITITSPTAGLTFSFDGGAYATYPTNGYITTAGTHSIAAQNANGCAASFLNNIIVNAQPASPIASTSASLISCFGGNSTITVSGTGGILPYEYRLNAGTYQTANTFIVTAGTYNLTVKDANGCTGTTNNLIITQPNVIAASANAGNIACSGGSTILTILATGGTGAYEYKINNGNFQTGNAFNVVAGNYTATIRLASNPACSTSITTPINISQPDSLRVTTTALAINQCGGTTQVKVVAMGGKAPYTGTGSFTKGPGKWLFAVTDANGCSSTSEITILPPGCVYVKVFPNPAQNIITINHSEAMVDAKIQVYAPNGAMVINKNVPQNAFITTLDVSKLASGIYVLVYTNATERKEIKFIKTNSK